MTFEKYHKIKILGDEDNEGIFDDPNDEIIIEEKLDGANFRFMFKDGRVIFGSRNQSIGDDKEEIGGSFKRCVEYVKKAVANKETQEGYIYYGECMVSHTMQYDWENIPPYLGFDIKKLDADSDANTYLSYEEKKEHFEYFDLPMVPLITQCKVSEIKKCYGDITTDKDVPISAYASPSAKDQQAEGIAIKNYKKGLFAKYVRDRFKEKNKEVFGDSKKWARQKGDEELIVATYCTNARIDKMIFKLIDEGNGLGMILMQLLPKRIIDDIFEEHSKEICMSNWSVNFKNIRIKINKRCVAVLKQIIVNNSLEKK